MTRHVDQEGIILVDTDPVRSRHVNLLVEAFLRHGRIASISLMDEEYDDFLEKDSGKYRAVTKSNREAKVRPYEVDHNFVETMNLELIHGRDFSLAQGDKDNLVLISESAAARLGFADPIDETIDIVRMSSREGRKPIGGRSGIGTGARIIGVVKDFTFESGYEDIPPGLLLLNPDDSADLMFVRVKPGDPQEVIQYMQEAWSGIVDDEDFDFSFLQQDLESRLPRRVSSGVGSSRGLRPARCSSPLLGAFALTALAAGRRTKEIGIRKALGASVFGLTTLMTREFACLALIGALVAWPLSWWWMHDWLNGFAFRIDLGGVALCRWCGDCARRGFDQFRPSGV